MKQKIQIFDYAGTIGQALPKGILLTTKAGDRVNTMTIGWGTLGVEWGRTVFTAYVRESRYTHRMLEENGEFTINVPLGAADSGVLLFCGRNSGRDVDKIRELGLHLEEPEVISVPGIRELPLTLECRVLATFPQTLEGMPREILDRYYPKDENGKQDLHTAYYAEVVSAYIITE